MPTLSANRDLPSSITNLRLCSALRDCGSLGVEKAFDKSEADRLYVYDDYALGHTDWVNQEPEFVAKTFRVHNPNATTLALLPLDGRIVTGPTVTKGGVCDCALLSTRQMSFVEFKTDVDSQNYKTILQRAEEAKKQLWHTYDGIIRPRCKKRKIDFPSLLYIDFYVVFDEELNVTGANSELMDLQADFLVSNKHELYFLNQKTFL